MQNIDINTFSVRILLAHDDIGDKTAVGYAVGMLTQALNKRDADIIFVKTAADAQVLINADPGIQCLLLNWDFENAPEHNSAADVLSTLRERNTDMPVFLLADRTSASQLPIDIMEKIDSFIWMLEDTPEFISGRIMAAIERYRANVLPPMFKALVNYNDAHEYSWHTPGHTGGTAFLKSPVGRAFFSFFGEQLFRSDLSVSVGELGSLLDHSGPIGESEKYTAGVFGAHRSYHVTNGSSMSNRVILMASVTRGQVTLCDRNCHKSVEQSMTLAGSVPTYMIPSRNYLGIIGPIKSDSLTPAAIKKSIAENALVTEEIDPTPIHAIITNSTYDGLCYNVKKVGELLGKSVDRLHYDEAWYGYARFNPIYEGRYGMFGDPRDYGADRPTVFTTQSTHKLLAGLSQSSMIHVRDGRNPIEHGRFNEAYMMHASTSPLYSIIASNDISAAMMSGSGGKALTTESIQEAVAFRQTLSRMHSEFSAAGDWFFNCWQPEEVKQNKNGAKVAFHEVSADYLINNPAPWVLESNAKWHGFGELEEDYCMLDPIKVNILMPGINADGSLQDFGVPAEIVSAYLSHQGVVAEKTSEFNILFLFSMGITKGKWGTLTSNLLEFKRDYQRNAPLKAVLPNLLTDYPENYRAMGLKDLCDAMFEKMKALKTTSAMQSAFGTLPKPDIMPVEAYENLVKNNIELLSLDEIAGRTIAVGVVPYPPGIPLIMPGENAGDSNGALINYLKVLESFDRDFPGFTHSIHGIERIEGKSYIMCIKN